MMRMAEHMDAMFNQCADGPAKDREFLYAVHNYHLEFHLKIAEFARCQTLRRTIEKNHVLIFNWLFDVAAKRQPLPGRFHRELIDELNQGDPERADRAMRAHIRYGVEANVNAIAERPETKAFERVK